MRESGVYLFSSAIQPYLQPKSSNVQKPRRLGKAFPNGGVDMSVGLSDVPKAVVRNFSHISTVLKKRRAEIGPNFFNTLYCFLQVLLCIIFFIHHIIIVSTREVAKRLCSSLVGWFNLFDKSFVTLTPSCAILFHFAYTSQTGIPSSLQRALAASI